MSRRASVRPSGLTAQVTLHGRGLGRGRKRCGWGHSGGPPAMLPASSTARDALGHAGATLVCPARCQPSELPSQPLCARMLTAGGHRLPSVSAPRWHLFLEPRLRSLDASKASEWWAGLRLGLGLGVRGAPRGSRARSTWLRSQQADEDGLPGWGRLLEEEGHQVCAQPPARLVAPSYRRAPLSVLPPTLAPSFPSGDPLGTWSPGHCTPCSPSAAPTAPRLFLSSVAALSTDTISPATEGSGPDSPTKPAE